MGQIIFDSSIAGSERISRFFELAENNVMVISNITFNALREKEKKHPNSKRIASYMATSKKTKTITIKKCIYGEGVIVQWAKEHSATVLTADSMIALDCRFKNVDCLYWANEAVTLNYVKSNPQKAMVIISQISPKVTLMVFEKDGKVRKAIAVGKIPLYEDDSIIEYNWMKKKITTYRFDGEAFTTIRKVKIGDELTIQEALVVKKYKLSSRRKS